MVDKLYDKDLEPEDVEDLPEPAIQDRELVTRPKEKELTEEDYDYTEEGEMIPKKYVGKYVKNPNGASRFIQDPRQELCWKYYIQGLYRGMPNGKAAALKAGYSETSAQNIGNIKWFKDRKAKLKRRGMVTYAESNLSKILRTPFTNLKILDDGTEIEEFDIDKAKIVKDVSIFVAETLGKDDGYSKKIEESKNVSHDIKIESISYADTKEIPEQAQDVIKEAVVKEIENE